MFNFANNNAVYFNAVVMNLRLNGDNLIMQMGCSGFNKEKDITILSGEEVTKLKAMDRTKFLESLVYARNQIEGSNNDFITADDIIDYIKYYLGLD